jgi:dihydrolipoamide dehydrogenase
MADNSELSFDLVIIGSGPGGYTGAIRASQLGLKTAVVEKDSTLGGTCLNVGCIPSKALLESSEYFLQAQHEFSDHGIKVSKVELDLVTMLGRKDKIVKSLTDGITYLFKKNKITSFEGMGSLLSANEVEVKSAGGAIKVLKAKYIMLATGSVPIELPFAKFDGKKIVSSTEALKFESVPNHLVVIGGGVIGLEMGSVWLRLGAKVTVIEATSKICGGMDAQATKQLQKILAKQGMEFMLDTKVQSVEVIKNEVKIKFEDSDKKLGEVKGDICLVAVGRKAYSNGVGLEKVGVEKDDRGRIKVNAHLQTNIPNIYAVGDVVIGPMLAHKAEEEGVAVAETLAGGHGHVNYETVPGVVYTWPELASVGKTEEELKAAGIVYKSGSFPFSANGRAKALGSTDGMVKVLADAKSDRILGVHIVGPRASDMIAEAVIAMEFGGSSEDLARSFHAHPTLSEVMREAALAVDKRARQM